MATYAMICDNRIIEVLHNQEAAPIWPPDIMGNLVTAIECSEEVTHEWKYDPETGEISEPIAVEYEETEPKTTQLDNIEESQLIIMEALAEQYELNEERRIDDLEVQAEIYEAILELGGNA